MLLPAITWQNIFHRYIDRLLLRRLDDADFGCKLAHLHCALVKYFVKLIGGWEVVT